MDESIFVGSTIPKRSSSSGLIDLHRHKCLDCSCPRWSQLQFQPLHTYCQKPRLMKTIEYTWDEPLTENKIGSLLLSPVSLVSGLVVQDPAGFLRKKLAVDFKRTSVQACKIGNQMTSRFLARCDSIILNQLCLPEGHVRSQHRGCACVVVN